MTFSYADVADNARKSAESTASMIKGYINEGNLKLAAAHLEPLECTADRAHRLALDAGTDAVRARESALAAGNAAKAAKRALAEARRRSKDDERAVLAIENDGKHTYCLHLTDEEVEAADRAICEAKRAATGGRA